MSEPQFIVEGAMLEKQFNNAPLFTLTVKQLKPIFMSWLSEMTQSQPAQEQPVKYLSRQEAAERLGISLVTLDKYCRLGIITRHKVGARYLIDPAELDKVITNK